ncbi:MAG TPA: hypothetical protein P5205_21285 [Candidatus Paceibacterota bacterium]|nr:hypothetical protein [Verrucomicrobiota bacterium]HSA12897.1 hypothetical protein [Candidatus Paceibacterota bacterium]
MNRFCHLALVWWVAALFGGTVTLQAALQFDVFLGYDGIVPQASWFPVVCEVKNDGPTFMGTVEVEAEYVNRGQGRRAVVELPTGTLKRFVIPVFSAAASSGVWNVRLLDERGKVRAEQTALRARRSTTSTTPLLGALVRTPAGLPVLRPILPQDQSLQPAVARLLPGIFPDNPLVLEGLDALYLNSEAALDLKAGQAKAVLAWLHGGGHLIVGVEQVSDITATPWLRGVLPCELHDIQPVQDHSGLQAWLRSGNWPAKFAGSLRGQSGSSTRGGAAPGAGVNTAHPFSNLPDDPAFELASVQAATGQLRDGQVLVAAGDKPLIVTATRGCGRVTLLLFSPEREPFRSWKNLPTLWARLAEVPGAWYVSADYRHPGGWSSDGIFGAMIDTRQVHKLPVTWLLLLLLVYLVVIGPLDRYWLKRIGRPMLTWITFPCYVVLFSLLIYFIGYKLRAGESEWNELHVVDVLSRGERAELRGRTYASVYSPSNQRYWLESRQEFSALRAEFAGQWNPGQSGDKATFIQAGDGAVRGEIFVPVWTSQLFVNDWWEPAPVPLEAAVTRQGAGWEVKVENHTEGSLTNVHIVIEDHIMPLGEIPAQKNKTFKIQPQQGKSLAEFVGQQGAAFQSAVSARQRTFGSRGSEHIDDLANGTMAASFLSQMSRTSDSMRHFITPPGLDLSPLAERGNAVLLAWAADYAPVKPMRQFTPRRTLRNTLWRVSLPVN